MTGHQYEHIVAGYLRSNGFFNVTVTKGSGDFGVDVIAHKGYDKYTVQCKYYSSPVSVSAVQEAVAGMAYYGCNKAMVVTNNSFTKAAKDLANANNVVLLENVYSPGSRHSVWYKRLSVATWVAAWLMSAVCLEWLNAPSPLHLVIACIPATVLVVLVFGRSSRKRLLACGSSIVHFILSCFHKTSEESMINTTNDTEEPVAPFRLCRDLSHYDSLLPQAVELVLAEKVAAVSMLQRCLHLDYPRAALLVEQMEELNIVGPFNGSKPRKLLISARQWALATTPSQNIKEVSP